MRAALCEAGQATPQMTDDKPTPSGLGGPERRPKYIVWHIARPPWRPDGAMQVADFNADAVTIAIRTSKSGTHDGP